MCPTVCMYTYYQNKILALESTFFLASYLLVVYELDDQNKYYQYKEMNYYYY